MRFYKYKKDNSNNITHILLENKDEVIMFLENKDIYWEQDVDNYIKMSLIEDKSTRTKLISHTMFRTPISILSRTMSDILYDNNYMINPSYFMNKYNEDMLSFIERFGNVFVNKVGGYCNIEAFDLENYNEVFNFNLNDIFNDSSYSFSYDNNNKFLVLENDPVLDKWTLNHFKGRFPYICNLRTIMKTNNFEDLLKKFKKYYSSKIFVYTTGLDYEQMIDYVERAIECGFDEFEWVFNGFENIKEFKEFLSTKNIKYKISFI